MSGFETRFTGLTPDQLKVRSARIILDGLEIKVDIGFHEFEIGTPQRLLVSAEIWLDDLAPPPGDDPALAWDYDFLRREIEALAAACRYNLQETLAHAVFERISQFHGVKAVRLRLSKPDVYPDAHGVGVEIASFSGAWPDN
ncbi:MAG: dihydroneopterin aldolase [Sphingomicrobium sp.]